MKTIVWLVFIALFIGLQYRLWVDKEGARSLPELQRLIQTEKTECQTLKHRNDQLDRQVRALKREPQAVEAYARFELGMIKKNETFAIVVDPEPHE